MSLHYVKLFDDVPDIKFATEWSACFDISAYIKDREITIYPPHNIEEKSEKGISLEIIPGDRVLVPTGLILDIMMYESVRIHPRSGLAIKNGITLINCEGVIDADYTDELMIPIINLSSEPFILNHGDRIAQGEIVSRIPTSILQLPSEYKIEKKTSRSGGFGSTGLKN